MLHEVRLSLDDHAFVVKRHDLLATGSSYFESFLRTGSKMIESNDVLSVPINNGGRTTFEQAQAFVQFIVSNKINSDAVNDTNAHALMNLICLAELGQRCDLVLLYLGAVGLLNDLLMQNMQSDAQQEEPTAAQQPHNRKRNAEEIEVDPTSDFAAVQILYLIDSGDMCTSPAVSELLLQMVIECLETLPARLLALFDSSSSSTLSSSSFSKYAKTNAEGRAHDEPDEGTSFLDWFSYCYSSTVGNGVDIKTTMFAMMFVTRPEIRYQLSPKMLRTLMVKLGSPYLSVLLQLEEIFQGHMCWINDHFEELKEKKKEVVTVVHDRLSWKEFSVEWGGDHIPRNYSSNDKTDRERALTAMPDTMLAKKVSEMRHSIMKKYHLVCGIDQDKYCSSDADDQYVYSSCSGDEEDDA